MAFVPRETFSQTQRSLEAIYERTTGRFELVCVDGGSPPLIKEYLQGAARDKGFTLVRSDTYVAPNQARNLALDHVTTDFVVFVDNDSLVAPGWLEALLRCADETGAWVVGPLYCESSPEGVRIHMSGGTFRITELRDGKCSYVERHHNQHVEYAQATNLQRHKTELIEFHTVLIRMTTFDKLGLFDPELTCICEHGDFCLSVHQAGGSVFIEPEAVVTYVPPWRLDIGDLEYFQLRWSEAWLEASIRRLTKKYNLSETDPEMDALRYWVRSHRRLRLTWIDQLPRIIGKKAARVISRRLVEPLEIAHNRARFYRRNKDIRYANSSAT
jgi:GT2 family glycosyltransferase